MSGLRDATTLLTRVPLGARRAERADLARSVPWFPVVGAGVGLAVAGVDAAARLALPPMPSATLAVGAGIVLTGAFHEDGLADVADAFGGGASREERLRILKDPALGTFGVLAIVVSFALRATSLASLGAWSAVAVLVAAHALGRTACAALLGTVPAADGSGLGAAHAGALERREVLVAAVAGVTIAAVALGPWAPAAVAIAAVSTWSIARAARARLGGLTGDVLGTAEQVVETLVLLLGAGVAHAHLLPAWLR